jgi:hypothetical protein
MNNLQSFFLGMVSFKEFKDSKDCNDNKDNYGFKVEVKAEVEDKVKAEVEVKVEEGDWYLFYLFSPCLSREDY